MSIEKVNIMGVNIAAIDMDSLVKYSIENLNDIKGKYICVTNVFATVTAYEDSNYLNVQNNAVLAIPDGGPLASVGRKRGYQISRTTGQDYMDRIFRLGYKHYFYGSTQETLDKMKTVLSKQYPEMKIVGMYSPPFRSLNEKEDLEVIEMINHAKPDFVWVGLGAPKQEFWMYDHIGKINALMVGVGAAFDYYAGNIKRAPMWMQKSNLEWVYRLVQEPKRLFYKYLITNTKFIYEAIIKRK